MRSTPNPLGKMRCIHIHTCEIHVHIHTHKNKYMTNNYMTLEKVLNLLQQISSHLQKVIYITFTFHFISELLDVTLVILPFLKICKSIPWLRLSSFYLLCFWKYSIYKKYIYNRKYLHIHLALVKFPWILCFYYFPFLNENTSSEHLSNVPQYYLTKNSRTGN